MARCSICGAELEGTEALDAHVAAVHGTSASDEPTSRPRRIWVVVGIVALALLVGALVGWLLADSDDDDPAASTETTTTTAPTTTTTTTATTTVPSTTTTTVAPPALTPGEPCELGSDRDCIDPEGDGQGTYLLGGGDCMDTFAPESSGLCSDLDGDGRAGYPDSG